MFNSCGIRNVKQGRSQYYKEMFLLSLLDIYLFKSFTNLKRYVHLCVQSSIIYSCQDKDPTNHIHTMECLSAIKKSKTLPPEAMWMALEGIVLSEVSLTEKDKYSDITYMWDLQNTRN